jgi:hypothetical protein
MVFYSLPFSAHSVHLSLHRLMTYSDQYNLWMSSLRNCLQSSVTSSLLDPNIHLSTLF